MHAPPPVKTGTSHSLWTAPELLSFVLFVPLGHFWSSSPSFSPALPYVVLGLGKAPNFIEDVSVGVFSREAHQFYKRWARLIPNSQIRVLCTPVAAPDK